MQTEIVTARQLPGKQGCTDNRIYLIVEGAKRELKLRQAAVIDQRIATVDGRTYLETRIALFARGRTFVLGASALLLGVILVAVYQSTEHWAERIDQYQRIALVIAVAIPLAYVYLSVEKRIRHHRLHQKVESKLRELIAVQP